MTDDRNSEAMNDLLQRLRGRAEFLRDIGRVKSPAIMESAADEIESLRAENEALKAEVRALHRNGEEAERWKVCLQKTFAVQMRLTARAETAERALAELRARIEAAPVCVMDKRDALGICAPAEEDFPALYALQGKRVRLLVEDGGK